MLRLQAQFDFWHYQNTCAHIFVHCVSTSPVCVCVCVRVCVCVCVHVLCQSPSLQLCPFMCWVMRWPCAQSGQLALSNCSLPSIHTNSSGLSELYSLIRRPGNWAASIAIPLPPPPSFIWKKTLKTATSSWRTANTARSRDINLGLLSECRNASTRQERAALQWPILRFGGGEIFTFKDLLNL